MDFFGFEIMTEMKWNETEMNWTEMKYQTHMQGGWHKIISQYLDAKNWTKNLPVYIFVCYRDTALEVLQKRRCASFLTGR